MSSKIFNTDLGDGFKRTLKPNKDTIFVDYTTIEIYGNYNLEIEVIGTPTNPIIVESVQFDGFNETNPDYATKTTISGEGTTTITTASTDNYLRISSDGLVVGDVQINLIVKKKNSVTIIESITDIPTTDIGCITVLTPELEVQGGSSVIGMCWNNTKGMYIPTTKVVFFKSDIVHLFTAGELGNEVTLATFNIPNILVHTGFDMKGLVFAGSITTELNTRFKRNVITIIKDTRTSSSKQAYDIYSKSQLDDNRIMYNSLNSVGIAGSFYVSGVYPMSGISSCSITTQVTAEFEIDYRQLEISINY